MASSPALVAAVVSAPVVAYLFGGVTGSGSTFIVALFLKAGQELLSAVLYSGLAAEPVDKTLQVLLAALLYRATTEPISSRCCRRASPPGRCRDDAERRDHFRPRRRSSAP